MAKAAKLHEIAIDQLIPYERNAKTHGPEQIEKLKASIREFGFVSPVLIDEQRRIIAGHGRVLAAKELGLKKIPAVYVEGLSEVQRRAYILADNRLSELGGWDPELVNLELGELRDEDFDIDLTGFDFDPDEGESSDWFETRDKWDDSRQEGNDEYNEFLDKFEQPKTTDDCYTPENIYEVIASYVERKYGKGRKDFVRPFYPGGDYQAYKYAPGSVVVDNPPFSILSQIVDFYVERQQPFFLFAPALSLLGLTNRESVTAICCHAKITYENGACVPTGFLTNLGPEGIAATADPELYAEIDEANDINEKAMRKSLPKYSFPVEVITAAQLGYLSKYGQALQIKRSSSLYIRELDAMKEAGKEIYGAGLLLSDSAAAERAAAERAAAERAAAERAAATVWPLSDREREIVKQLGANE